MEPVQKEFVQTEPVQMEFVQGDLERARNRTGATASNPVAEAGKPACAMRS